MSLALVTGASGFIGQRLALRLVAGGERVRGLVRDPVKAAGLVAGGVETVTGTVSDPAAADAACAGVDTVYHLASVLGPASVPDAEYVAANVTGTQVMIAAAERAGVRRFVHVSTVGVLGSSGAAPVKEDAPLKPRDIYERTKAEAEALVLAAHRERGFPVVIARPAWVYGPGDRRTLKLFRAINRGRLFLVGRGDALQHPVHVDDVVNGLLLCASTAAVEGEIFHLGGADILPVRELCQAIARACGGELPAFRLPLVPLRIAALLAGLLSRALRRELPLDLRKLNFFVTNRAYSIEKARALLNFNPSVPLAEGLAQTADWYRKEGWL